MMLSIIKEHRATGQPSIMGKWTVLPVRSPPPTVTSQHAPSGSEWKRDLGFPKSVVAGIISDINHRVCLCSLALGAGKRSIFFISE